MTDSQPGAAVDQNASCGALHKTAQAQLERSRQSISESIELQRVAVARQAQVRNIALPLILVLLVLLGYLLIKWRVL